MPVPSGSRLAGHTLADAEIPARTGLLVVAIQHGEDRESFIYNPGSDEEVRPGDVRTVMGRPRQIDALRAALA